MSQRAAIRRRKQWQHGFKNLPPMTRPRYNKTSLEKKARKAQMQLEKQRQMQQRRAGSKK